MSLYASYRCRRFAESFRLLPAQGANSLCDRAAQWRFAFRRPALASPTNKKWTGLRNLYRYLPFARSTYRHAAAIIIASYHMRAEFAAYRDKLFFVPENGIAGSLCSADSRSPEPGAKLELIFVGGLVPRKACYIGLRAAAPLLRKNLARFTVIGDGPERNRLEELARSLEIEKAVSFCGWLSHAEVLSRLRSADVVVLPAIREGRRGRGL